MASTQDSATQAKSTSRAGRSLWADARRRLFRDKGAMICLVVIGLYVLVALGGIVYDGFAEQAQRAERKGEKPVWDLTAFEDTKDYAHKNEAPTFSSFRGLLGTDWGGKSVLYKMLLGAKVSMTVGFMANIIAVPLGIVLGAIAGYYGGWLDDLVVWLYTTLACIPGIIKLIAIKYAFQGVQFAGLDLSGIHGLYIALALVSWIGTCRLVRAETLKIRELDYVLAARAIGTPSFVILLRHIIPNLLHLGIIMFSLGFVGAVKAEVMLSYLGLGVDVGVPSWGGMINAARMDLFQGRWWELTAAVTAMFFLVLALNIFGDRLRDALDPKLRTL